MALEAVVYHQDLFGFNNNNNGLDHLYPLLLDSWAASDQDHDHHYLLHNQSTAETDWHFDADHVWDYSTHVSPSPPALNNDDDHHHDHQGDDGIPSVEVMKRPKRRRSRVKKNKEDIENQRMTHIAVERNRRKQMNDYLNVLRSIMPDSYVHRGDQASIIGGAINFVKELEQNLQYLSAKKHMNENNLDNKSSPFGEFFSFPQYSSTTVVGGGGPSSGDDDHELKDSMSHHHLGGGGGGSSSGWAADVEVTMAESHALVKIITKQPPKQLSKLVSGLQGLRLTTLHLNATKVDGFTFYSFSVKVEDENIMSSVDEIASAVYQLLGRIQD